MILRHAARSLFSKLPRSLLYETFYQSARALGVRHYGANGPVGTFFGPLYDQSVIKPYLRTGSWSDNIVGLFQEFFRDRSGTLYDIGANIGLISVPVARNLRVRVVAFEPDGENCALLRANAAFAEAAIEIVNAAVAEHAGTLSFKRSEYNCGDH